MIRRLLRALYPKDFRRYVRTELDGAWTACVERERSRHGRAGIAYAWIRIVFDALTSSISIRADLRRTRRIAALHDPPGTQGATQMSSFIQDVRYGIRLLSRAPGFTIVAILTLALGIGASATLFSVVRGVLLRPLPYSNPDQLVRVFEQAERSPKFPMAPADFRDYRGALQSFDSLAAYMREDLQLAEGDRPEQLRGMQVTSGFFQLLGWRPALGREFLPAEEIEGNDDVVILSDALWKRRFGGNPAVIGTTVHLSGRLRRVVGVLPPGFQHVGGKYRSHGHGEGVDIWAVRTVPRDGGPAQRFSHYFNVVGRLRAGVTTAQANEDLRAVGARVAKDYPGGNSPWTSLAVPLKSEIIGTAADTLVTLLGAAEIVLLLACVNVAGLLLGRAGGRAREIGVRAALGATRIRLAWQLLVESFVLALAGGGAGILLTYAAIRSLARFGPADIPRLQMVTVDTTVLAYAAAATMLTALLSGIVPAVQLAREGVAGTLKAGGRTVSQQRLRRTLAGVELALAFVLVVSATLLLRSFVALARTDPGFKSAGVLTATVGLPAVRYGTRNAVAFYDRVATQVRALPGVQFAGFTSDLPWSGYDENSNFGIIGRTFPDNQEPEGRYHFVTPGLMRALGVPLVAGRDLTAGDTADAPAVVLINDRLARLYWASGEAAIGARLDLWGAKRTVVGVVGDVRDQPSDEQAAGAFYFPEAQQWYSQDMLLAVRTTSDPLSLAEPLRRILHDADPQIPLASVQPLDAVARAAMGARHFTLSLVAVFGGASLFLAVVGVYGVMAQGVAQRAREFGVRQALGARPADILRLVLSNGLAIGAIGVLTGLALAFVSTRWMASLLYHVKPIDPWTFGAVAALVVSVAAAASYLPARRATRIDPMVALRYE